MSRWWPEQEEGIICFGDFCGWCGHVHKRVDTAKKCLDRHKKGCEMQGGYSDRKLFNLETQTYLQWDVIDECYKW